MESVCRKIWVFLIFGLVKGAQTVQKFDKQINVYTSNKKHTTPASLGSL